MKNSVFADHAKESKTKDIRTDVDIADIKNALRKHIYRAQVELDILKILYSFLSFCSVTKYNNNNESFYYYV